MFTVNFSVRAGHVYSLRYETHQVEDRTAAIVGVTEAPAQSPSQRKVIALGKPDGTERLCIAFVLDPEEKLEDMRKGIAPILPPNLGEVQLIRLDEIPRSMAGKVQRDAVRRLIESRV